MLGFQKNNTGLQVATRLIDKLRPDKPDVKRYTEVLDSLKLKQVVTKATRTTMSGKTLIDYLITSLPSRVTHTGVIPCPLISNHDAPYFTVSVRVTRYAPRLKYIRNEKQFCEIAFIKDFTAHPFEVV